MPGSVETVVSDNKSTLSRIKQTRNCIEIHKT
uniref:Uncharacterized protein n=1 Tax=Anguilla anguilla TaxID=7936 RepID=A0A0E9RRZ1_ANGAN